MRIKKNQSIFLFIVGLILLTSCVEVQQKKIVVTPEALGEILFFDPILSRDSTISCASCHKPEFAFADNLPVSLGTRNRKGERNTPSVMNLVDRNFYFWDGRAESLEEQALGPMQNHSEMDLPLSLIIKRLNKNNFYKQSFYTTYGKIASVELMANAIASYEKTLETSKSAFDKYMKQEDTSLFSESAKRGLDLFNNKGKCFDCHFGPDFTGNDRFKNIGLYDGIKLNDKGRFNISGDHKDLGSFKVPGLRNIAQTAPYMHNGMFKSLEEVIDYYDEPDKIIKNAINRDTLLKKPLGLSPQEKKDLKNFLLSLSDERFDKNKGKALQ
jgi:cytochrome c peroxidase